MNIDKWNRYVHTEVNEYSATTEWTSAQEQHLHLMSFIPEGTKTVLDLGCGDGWSVHTLMQRGFEVTGVTINPREVKHAKEKYNIDLYLQDMHDLQFNDHWFDCVYCRECYEHAVAPYIVLCEINRVLELGGHALIHVPNQDWVREPSHFSVFNTAQMDEMFRKCLFDVVSSGPTGVGLWYLGKKTKDIP
jgi:ubiquinone/menaquinone biosynthesis C-methylase UbiE